MRFLEHLSRAVPLLGLIGTLAGCAGNGVPVEAAPEDLLAHAEAKLAGHKYLDAAEALEYFLRSHPGTALTPIAKIRLGDARYGLEEYLLAEGEYHQVVSDFPASPLVEEARFKIAQCAYGAVLPYQLDQTETERALQEFEDFRRDYPASRFLPEVEGGIRDCREQLAHGEYENGLFYRDRQRFKPAAIQFKYIVQQYPETEWAPRAALGLAEMYSVRERWEDAASWFRRIRQQWPDTAEAESAAQALSSLPGDGTLSRLPADQSAP